MKEFRTVVLILAYGLFVSFSAMAEIDLPPAVPVGDVSAEALPLPDLSSSSKEQNEGNTQDTKVFSAPSVVKSSSLLPPLTKNNGGIVLELFTTQACTFCPKADEAMKGFLAHDDVIALSCHVDYFDVQEGSLSLPICSTRQIAYEKSLNIGPKYTPQMVMNGRYDAIGYHEGEVSLALKKANKSPFTSVSIREQANGLFSFVLPYVSVGEYKIWLFVYEMPIHHKITDGANLGKDMTYYNVISKAGFLGAWNGQPKVIQFNPKMGATSKGFAVLVQDAQSNHILIAGKFER